MFNLKEIMKEYLQKVSAESAENGVDTEDLPIACPKLDSPKKESQTSSADVPPNCYDSEGKIHAYSGVYSYKMIFRYTSQKLDIKRDGEKLITCSKCFTEIEYKRGNKSITMKKLVCGDCRRKPLRYFDWCFTGAQYMRGALLKKGLLTLADNFFVGYDVEKRALIFPLNQYQYVELPFANGEYTCTREEGLKVLMHYNRELAPIEGGGFKPLQYGALPKTYIPYLDNRFFGVNGEVVIAESSVKAEILLPF